MSLDFNHRRTTGAAPTGHRRTMGIAPTTIAHDGCRRGEAFAIMERNGVDPQGGT
jgi:hypothetical protein